MMSASHITVSEQEKKEGRKKKQKKQKKNKSNNNKAQFPKRKDLLIHRLAKRYYLLREGSVICLVGIVVERKQIE